MNLYEHTIIARQDTSPSEIKQLTEKYSKIVEKNEGEIVKTENWGLLNLSYLIKILTAREARHSRPGRPRGNFCMGSTLLPGRPSEYRGGRFN